MTHSTAYFVCKIALSLLVLVLIVFWRCSSDPQRYLIVCNVMSLNEGLRHRIFECVIVHLHGLLHSHMIAVEGKEAPHSTAVITCKRALEGNAKSVLDLSSPSAAWITSKSGTRCSGLVTATIPASIMASRDSEPDTCCTCSTRCFGAAACGSVTTLWASLVAAIVLLLMLGLSLCCKLLNREAASSFALSPMACRATCTHAANSASANFSAWSL